MNETSPIKPKILIFVGYYLPGYKAGGPLRTISNMVDHLSKDFEFWIVTRDRDLGGEYSYINTPLNKWIKVGEAQVYYCSPEQQTFLELSKIINKTTHDLLYLNSFFDYIFTIKPLILRLLGALDNTPVLLAPRGEFSMGALKLNRFKKFFYILVSKLLGLYQNITWHASSSYEVKDIRHSFPRVEPLVALDLPAKLNSDLVLDDMYSNNFHKNILRVVFLSRISPMKNLDYALRVLSQVNTEVVFDIYGPLEDLDYWESCQSLIKELPQNIQVQYCGTALFTEVGSIFSRYDLFLFPTRGENYGHVIAESLSVGTCVLLSDQTPWQNLTIDRLGWDLTLSDILTFVEIVESMSLKSISDKLDARKHIISVMRDKLTSPLLIQKNQELFYKCLR